MSCRPWIALGAVVLAAAACGGGDQRPLRIGVVVDCVGAFRALEDQELAGAQLPLIARGATTRGTRPSDGVRGAQAAGRPVEIVRACGESGEFATLTQVARQLVEREHVAAVVVGGPFSVDGIALRDVARRYPGVAFIAAANGPREVTLQRPAPNVYRVAPDLAQGVAGLATSAYETLGWRRVALLLDDWVVGWQGETAFVREFCSLGGRVTGRIALAQATPPKKVLARIPRSADGVAVLASSMSMTPDLLNALARRGARTLVLGPDVTGTTGLVRNVDLAGVLGASYTPDSPALEAYLRAYAKAYPGAGRWEPRDELVIGYRNAVEAILQAVERARGDQGRLGAQLAHLDTKLLGVPVRMDANHQAVVSSSLVRLGPPTESGMPAVTAVGSVPNVDQSVGGLVPADYEPSSAGERCR